jgi:hypothetical protein
MKRLFLVFCLLMGCARDQQLPPGILSQEKMIEIMADLHLAEAKIKSVRITTTDSARNLFAVYELAIFDKYNTDSAQFNQSKAYYLEHPALMQSLNTALLDTLNRRQNRL